MSIPQFETTLGDLFEQVLGDYIDGHLKINNEQMTPDDQANLVPNTRLQGFIDTFNLRGKPERKAMLGGRKLSRRRKSKSQRRKKSKSQRRRKSIKRRH